MANAKDWIEGARLRTLSAGISPVIAGTGIAMWLGAASFPRFVLAAIVALALQIGSNYSNDYSDGIRGTDDVRTGPARLTGGGKARPRTVKMVAFTFYGIGAVAGLGLVALSGAWWLLGIGVLAIVAAWLYTGGKHPYGYMGLGEIFVFVFFGLVACAGTTYTQAGSVPWQGWLVAASLGFIACAVLMANNIRDIPTDKEAGKMTLAVRLGDRRARIAYVLLCLAPVAAMLVVPTIGKWGFLYLPALFLAAMNARRVLGTSKEKPAQGLALIPVLRDTGFVELLYAIATFFAFAFLA
ncbi:MAG: 1,4-dihydroxy-2-naphthoate polyprenyltransferase [Actinomycetaceae bacterium]|nr:1,4-dihydroxy-2-naphthoate polyprenyltransferase [Actinomycetaceae bacterium]